MTVAIVTNTAWNIYNFRLGLAKELIRLGCRVVAISVYDDCVREIEEAGCTFVSLKRMKRKGRNPLTDLSLMFELKKIFQQEKIDISLQYTIKPNIYGSIAAGLCGIKSISSVTGLGYTFLSGGLLNKFVFFLYRTAFNKTSLTVFQNEEDRETFIKEKLVDSRKTKLIRGSGVNMNRFKRTTEIDDTSMNFLFVGRLLYDKGIREFIAASNRIAKKYNNVKFTIIGAIDQGNPSAVDEKEIERWDKNENMSYLGVKSDVIPIMLDANVIVNPSYREGLPRVNLEAMSLRIPIITTDVTGCRDTVIDGENGFLVNAKKIDDLTLAMEKMIDLSSDERIQMGKKGRQMAQEIFDERIVINSYIDSINELMKIDLKN